MQVFSGFIHNLIQASGNVTKTQYPHPAPLFFSTLAQLSSLMWYQDGCQQLQATEASKVQIQYKTQLFLPATAELTLITPVWPSWTNY